MNMRNLLLLNLAIILIGSCYSEVFTAMSDVSRLLTTEGEMIRTVENYIHAQEERLNKLRSDLLEMERVHEMAVKSPESFLANPLNAYLLIKRLTIDWGDLKTILGGDSVGQKEGEDEFQTHNKKFEFIFEKIPAREQSKVQLKLTWPAAQAILTMLSNLTSITQMLSFPDEEDLNGVALALTRLQDTYKLNTSDLAQGNIMGLYAYRELAAADCFELGRQSYNTGDFYHTMLWMNEALKKHSKETNSSVDHFEILEYLAFSTYKQGNVRQALKLTNDLLDEKPDHQRGLGNKVYYEKILIEEQTSKLGDVAELLSDEAVSQSYTIKEKSNPLDSYQQERNAYERLCRGEGRISPKISKKFTCFYKYGPAPFLKLARVKSEVAFINPTLTIFHDVLYDEEIANIKALATPRFKRATVQNYKTGELETAAYRVSKSSWLKTGESHHVTRVNERIEQITGLNLETAEELQVANYGIGGHYEPHFDYARREEKDAFKNLGTGNRIATFLFYFPLSGNTKAKGYEAFGNRISTWLFYMTDVDAGGATVFPRLELSLWPKKGAALFWHNLHPSGEGIELTRHAACPVLVGTKWVSNKWMHERGQEFRRPCTLNKNDF